jgi:NAD(P)-dependent dehydrogenase (short-subunit alcohol dehydrogenase family)
MNMSRIFVTGSADGLGKMAAQLLIDQGHQVVLHARNKMGAQEAQTRDVAEQVNRLGPFDAVINNVGVGYREPRRIQTEEGLPHVFGINTLAPYLLTALIHRPKRLIYLSSGLHRSGDISLEDLSWERRPWQGAAVLLARLGRRIDRRDLHPIIGWIAEIPVRLFSRIFRLDQEKAVRSWYGRY